LSELLSTLDLVKESIIRCDTVAPLIAINPPMVRCVFATIIAETQSRFQIEMKKDQMT
jgi:hypothetical protein